MRLGTCVGKIQPASQAHAQLPRGLHHIPLKN